METLGILQHGERPPRPSTPTEQDRHYDRFLRRIGTEWLCARNRSWRRGPLTEPIYTGDTLTTPGVALNEDSIGGVIDYFRIALVLWNSRRIRDPYAKHNIIISTGEGVKEHTWRAEEIIAFTTRKQAPPLAHDQTL